MRNPKEEPIPRHNIQTLPERIQEMLPPPNGMKWQRLNCPMCGHARAAVSYEKGEFMCWACTPDICWHINEYVVFEFHDQIRNIVNMVKTKFGKWVFTQDLLNKAHQLVWTYSEGELGQTNDAGKLWEWEDASNGDPEMVRRYVGQALKGDLMNYADGIVKKVKRVKNKDGEPVTREILTGSAQGFVWMEENANDSKGRIRQGTRFTLSAPNAPDADFSWLYLALAEDDRVPFTSWGREILRCEKTRNGVGPIKGHCHWCDRQLRPDDRWERKYGHRVMEDDYDDYNVFMARFRPDGDAPRDSGSFDSKLGTVQQGDYRALQDVLVGGDEERQKAKRKIAA